jgi:hypothetical protein
MIYSTHLNKYVTRVKSCDVIMSLYTFSGQLDSLLDRPDNDSLRTVLKVLLLIASMGNETVHITVVARRSPSYKYLLRSPLGTISHSFSSSLSRLGFPSLVLCFPTMEGKRGIKRECSLSVEGSPAARDAKTPPPAPSGTPSPLGPPAEVSSRRPRSPVLEQGGPSGTAPVVDLSPPSDEEEPIHDTARDVEFAQHLFDELNRDLLGSPGDDKVIILSDSDKEKEEAHEEKYVSTEDAATSATVNPVSTASVDDIGTPAEKSLTPGASHDDVDNDPRVEPNDSSDGLAPGPKVEEGTGDGDEAGAP